MAWATWKDVPIGEQNAITGMVDLWKMSIGFAGLELGPEQFLALANNGVLTQHDMGQFVAQNWANAFGTIIGNMPWAQYGLDKDTYQQMSTAFGTEYKKVTGQDITKDALAQAFASGKSDPQGLLTASQYAQQLMNDQNIQNTYGWVKYGLDFSQWTQQKLQSQIAFGRSINDAEAATFLQYNKAAAGSNVAVSARQAGGQQQQQAVGVGGSVVR
jgi:hypothetical protein